MADDPYAKLLGGAIAGAPSQRSYVEDFLRSGVSSVGEMFGFDPVDGAEQFRQDNPISGIASELIGTLVPYGAMAKVSQLPRYANILSKIQIAERPILSGALKEAVRFAPLELGAAAGQIANGKDPVGALEGAGINLGLMGMFGAFGGLGSKIVDAAKYSNPEKLLAESIQKKFPDFDIGAPKQEQFQSAFAKLQAGGHDPETVSNLTNYTEALSRRIRAEGPPTDDIAKGTFTYVRPTESGDHTLLSKLYHERGTNTRAFLQGDGYFPSTGDIDATALRFGLGPGWEGLTQFPRHVQFKQASAAERFAKTVRQEGISVGNETWMAKEKDSGLTLVMRRANAPTGRSWSPQDEWVLFKTNKPDLFAPQGSAFANAVHSREAWDPYIRLDAKATAQRLQAKFVSEALEFKEAMPFQGAFGVAPAEFWKTVGKGMKTLGIDAAATNSAAAVGKITEFAKRYVAPAAAQFSKSPLARYVLGVSNKIFDSAEASAQRVMFGQSQLGPGSLLRNVASQNRPRGGIDSLIHDANGKSLLTDRDLSILTEAYIKEEGVNFIASKGGSPALLRLVNALAAEDQTRVAQIMGTERLARGSGTKFRPRENHFGMARTWEGDFRMPVQNEAGNYVAMGAGKTEAIARQRAQRMLEDIQQQDPSARIRLGRGFQSDREKDLAEATNFMSKSQRLRQLGMNAEVNIRSAPQPRTIANPRLGMAGYQGYLETLNSKQLSEIIYNHIQHTERWMASESIRYAMQSELRQLNLHDPELAKQLWQRILDRSGEPTLVSKLQNSMLDKVAAPILGKNSASKIASAGNELMFNWQLGMGNLVHPITNALQFMQTVVPHVFQVINGSPIANSKYYTFFPILDNGRTRGHIGTVDMLKLMKQSFKEMGTANTNPELRQIVEQLAREGVVDPRMIEQVMGQNAKQVYNLKQTFSDPKGYHEGIRAVSSFLPALSEKFSRMHAATTGYLVGRDFLNLQGPQLQQFVREFTQNTTYGYAIADRPRLLTGPIGSAFGLFKNWQFHYMAQMMQYADEAFTRGNWHPFLWQLASTGAISGVKGLPLYGVADQLSKWVSDKSLMENIYDMFGYSPRGSTGLSDLVFYGLPAFGGLSLQSSTASPGADITRDLSQLTSSVWIDRGEAVGRALGNALKQWQATGDHPIESKLVQDNVARALAPRSVYRAIQAVQDEKLRSMNTGYPITDALKWNERLLYGAGLNPLYVEKTQAAADILWRDSEKRRELTTSMGRAWADAIVNNRGDNLSKITATAIAHQIDLSSVIRSATAFMQKQEQPTMQRQFRPQDWSRFSEITG